MGGAGERLGEISQGARVLKGEGGNGAIANKKRGALTELVHREVHHIVCAAKWVMID